MSTFNSKKSKVPQLELSGTENMSIHIPEKSMLEINYLCTNISTIEWSGVLFFKVLSGSLQTQNMLIEVVEVYPMNKGTTGSTGYKFTPDVAKRHVELMKEHKCMIKIGMIHSHHNMDAYFSGVDMDELNENSENHNWYLSIVVNNAGKIVARIGYRAETEIIKKISGPIKLKNIITTEKTFIYFDVNVTKSETKNFMPEMWLNKFTEINKNNYNYNYDYNNFYNNVPNVKFDNHKNKKTFNNFEKFNNSNNNYERLSSNDIICLTSDDGVDFDDFNVDDRVIINKFITEALFKIPKVTTIKQSLNEILFNTAIFVKSLPNNPDDSDLMLNSLLNWNIIENWLYENDLNSNVIYFYELILETIRKSTDSKLELFKSIHDTKKAASICSYIIDNIIEYEELVNELNKNNQWKS